VTLGGRTAATAGVLGATLIPGTARPSVAVVVANGAVVTSVAEDRTVPRCDGEAVVPVGARVVALVRSAAAARATGEPGSPWNTIPTRSGATRRPARTAPHRARPRSDAMERT
jgi:hypothetical protein